MSTAVKFEQERVLTYPIMMVVMLLVVPPVKFLKVMLGFLTRVQQLRKCPLRAQIGPSGWRPVPAPL